MHKAVISGATREIGKPKGYDAELHGPCLSIHIRDETRSGLQFMTSAWACEPEEAGRLLAGANFELGVQGIKHPIVSVGVGAMPDDFEPVFTITYPCVVDPDGRKAIRVHRISPKASIYADAWIGEAGVPEAFGRALADIDRFALANGMA
jgi:hypothetical protein